MVVFITKSRSSNVKIVGDSSSKTLQNPTKKYIDQKQWELVDKLLLEKIPIAGISRVTGISETWLQQYINNKYEGISKVIDIKKKEDR